MEGRCCVLSAVLLGAGVGPQSAWGDAQATWLWDVKSQNGDAVVEPGETATVVLSIDFDPNVGEPGLTGETVQGIGWAIWDTLGGANSDKGAISGWVVLNNLDNLTGDLTTTDGVSLFGTNAAQLGQGPWADDDPVDVLSFEWATDDYFAYTVEYMTSTAQMWIWEGPNTNEGEYVDWPFFEGAISFQVVPAPATFGFATLGVLAVGRRRRRRWR
jgi:hypothetical protein